MELIELNLRLCFLKRVFAQLLLAVNLLSFINILSNQEVIDKLLKALGPLIKLTIS